MIYDTYEIYKNKYYNAQNEYDKILSEKEKIFLKTQPKSTKFDNERVNGGSPNNSFDEYVIALQEKKIDERLEEAKSIMEDRGQLLKLKEQELRLSKDWLDIIYVYYYIEKLNIRKIANRIPYSSTEVFRKLQKIKSKLEQKGTKRVVQ